MDDQLPDLDPDELRRREAKVAEAQVFIFPKWYDAPLVEEEAAKPSKALKAVLKRKWHVMGGTAPKADEEA